MPYQSNRNLWVDYLRSGITVLVVAHHSSLAYTTFARFDKTAYINSTHPIVDSGRWIGLDIFENFNDVFFMSLMFLIGGLFLCRSIARKGRPEFIKDRFSRLFIPFLFLGTLLMLIAYFPAYFVAHGSTDIVAYVKDFFVVEKWPVGPPWFIWVLFFFNLLFAAFSYFYQKAGAKTERFISKIKNKPFLFFLVLYCITWVLYVPAAYKFGAGRWTGLGPFDFQLSRALLYFGYFSIGIIIGRTDFNNVLFSDNSKIVEKWKVWVLLALVAYSVLTLMERPLIQMVHQHKLEEFYAWMIYFLVYTASCTLSIIAFITAFRKLVRNTKKWWNSLSDNAYLIYLVHYIFVIWCQFLLLSFNIPVVIKFFITFVISLSLSWLISNMFRKIKIVNKYL